MDATGNNERMAVKAGIDAWIKAVELREDSLLPQVAAQDADLVWIGPSEWLAGFDQLTPAMQAQNAALHDIQIDVSYETIHISTQGDMAWATNQWIFNARLGDQALALPLRCTWILEKREGRWILVHFHKSAEMPR